LPLWALLLLLLLLLRALGLAPALRRWEMTSTEAERTLSWDIWVLGVGVGGVNKKDVSGASKLLVGGRQGEAAWHTVKAEKS